MYTSVREIEKEDVNDEQKKTKAHLKRTNKILTLIHTIANKFITQNRQIGKVKQILLSVALFLLV